MGNIIWRDELRGKRWRTKEDYQAELKEQVGGGHWAAYKEWGYRDVHTGHFNLSPTWVNHAKGGRLLFRNKLLNELRGWRERELYEDWDYRKEVKITCRSQEYSNRTRGGRRLLMYYPRKLVYKFFCLFSGILSKVRFPGVK